MHTKSVPFELKAGGEKGTFEALVAVFGNVDSVGDRIVPGAFAKTLAQWRKSGDPIPVIFNHDWASAHAHIGVVNDAVEAPGGLLVKGTLDVADNDVAKQVHKLMARRSLREFSFGYRVPQGGEKRAKDGANELIEIDLIEVGPTLKGANPATELHAVKSALGVDDEKSMTADELRDEATRVEREVEAQQVPDDVPEVVEVIEAVVVDTPLPTPVPKSDSELRKQAAQVERELNERRVPEVTQPVPDPEPEPEPAARPQPKSDRELRKLAATIERDLHESRTPEVRERIIEVPVEPEGPDLAAELADVKSQLAALVEAMKRPEKDPAELKAEADRTAREVEQTAIPEDVAPAPPEPENTELQEVKNTLAEMRQVLDALKQKADETDKAPTRVRSVDTLRQQADAVALEVASGGQSLRRPPNPVPTRPPEPSLSLDDLKARMRNEMVNVLSGGMEPQ